MLFNIFDRTNNSLSSPPVLKDWFPKERFLSGKHAERITTSTTVVRGFPEFTDRLATRVYSELTNKLRSIRNSVEPNEQKKYKFNIRHNYVGQNEPDPIIITVKFQYTQKRIRFIFSTSNPESYEIQLHIKTNNIIENISNLHELENVSHYTRENTSITDISRRIDDVLDWGFTRKVGFAEDVHKVPARVVNVGTQRCHTDVLYVDVVSDIINTVDRTGQVFGTITSIKTYSGNILSMIDCPSASYIKVGDVVLSNYRDEFIVLELVHSKKHVIYTNEDVIEINNRIYDILEETK